MEYSAKRKNFSACLEIFMNIKLNYRNKSYTIKDVRVCFGLQKIIGLMFSSKEKAKPLLFQFSKPTALAIHSFFVFFPFHAIWLDNQNKILEIRKIVPFQINIQTNGQFSKLLEVPCNKKYAQIIAQLS